MKQKGIAIHFLNLCHTKKNDRVFFDVGSMLIHVNNSAVSEKDSLTMFYLFNNDDSYGLKNCIYLHSQFLRLHQGIESFIIDFNRKDWFESMNSQKISLGYIFSFN